MSDHLKRISEYAGHQAEIKLPIEGVTFELVRLTGTEQLSSLYEYSADVAVITPRYLEPGRVMPADLIEQPVSIHIAPTQSGNHSSRWIHGLIRDYTSLPHEQPDGHQMFRLTIVPYLAFWNCNIGYRIYEESSVTDIVSDLASEKQVTPVVQVASDYPLYRYQCQYEESDLNFLTRLFEADGIIYYFRHGEQQHQWVITDYRSPFEELSPKQVMYDLQATQWRTHYQSYPGVSRVCGFDVETGEIFSRQESTVRPLGSNEICEQTRKGFGVDNRNQAQTAARLNMERGEARHELHSAQSIRADVAPGTVFQLVGHPNSRLDQAYFVTGVSHAFDRERGYRNSFHCVPYRPDTKFRPASTASRPNIRGPETAIVVTECPDPENWGMVQVDFTWSETVRNRCWIRFAEMAAGVKGRTWFPPREGDEVMVEFINGDPNRPVITGRLYNGANPPEEDSPHVIAIRTESDQQLRFEDTNGAESVLLHGTKDVTISSNLGSVTIQNGLGTTIVIKASGDVEVQAVAGVKIQATQVELSTGMLQVNAGFTRVSGVVQCSTLITNSVVSPSYTPGVGNIW